MKTLYRVVSTDGDDILCSTKQVAEIKAHNLSEHYEYKLCFGHWDHAVEVNIEPVEVYQRGDVGKRRYRFL